MAANVVNRETVRDEIVGLLSAALTGVGNPAQAVYGYQVADFQGQSPVVVVTSRGSRRTQNTYGETTGLTEFDYEVHVFTLYAEGTAWTEADAEDRADLLEKEIADTIADNRGGSAYDYLAYADDGTVMDAVELGGAEYKHEVIPIVATILN